MSETPISHRIIWLQLDSDSEKILTPGIKKALLHIIAYFINPIFYLLWKCSRTVVFIKLRKCCWNNFPCKVPTVLRVDVSIVFIFLQWLLTKILDSFQIFFHYDVTRGSTTAYKARIWEELVVEDRISVLENLCRRPVPDGCLGGEVEAEREAWRSPFCFQQVDTGQTLPVTTNIVRRKLFTSENNIYIWILYQIRIPEIL